jgi:hypothetical protein
MSQQHRDALDQLLRDAPFDLGGDVARVRPRASRAGEFLRGHLTASLVALLL